MDQVIVFFGMSVVLAMLGMVVFAMGLAYQRLARRNHTLYQELTKINQDIKNEHEKVILDAQSKAQAILSDASKRAQSLIESSDIFADEYKTQFRARLMQVLTKEEEEFQKMYEGVKIKSNEVVANVTNSIEKTLANEMQQIRQTMISQMEVAMQDYKKASYARLEEEVSRVVTLIAKDVLRKSLNADEQKRLVIDALTEAKQHNVF